MFMDGSSVNSYILSASGFTYPETETNEIIGRDVKKIIKLNEASSSSTLTDDKIMSIEESTKPIYM